MSWTQVLTEAILLQNGSQITHPEQAFLLREIIRFLSHESVGVNGYTSMPVCWTTVVSNFQSGGCYRKGDDEVGMLIAGWHQECRDLSLQLSQFLGRKVEVRISKRGVAEPSARVADDAEELCRFGHLRTRIRIPDTASDLSLTADLRSRTIRVSMELEAPRDKQRTSSRVNWLLRQLKNVEPLDVVVRMKWSSRAADSSFSLLALAENPRYLDDVQPNSSVRAFEIIMNSSSGRRFRGRRTFIEEVETTCLNFYEQVGQHIKAWHPNPPRPRGQKPQNLEKPPAQLKAAVRCQRTGNSHAELLEVPGFLRKIGSVKKGQAKVPDALIQSVSHQTSKMVE